MIETILSKLSSVKSVAGGYVAHCPAHDDNHASLSIAAGDDGRILLHCHAGCTMESIVEAIGITLADLFPETPQKPKRKIVKVYPYRNENGALVYESVRYQPKSFSQRRPDPNTPGKYIHNLKGIKPLLYRLPELIESVKAGKGIIIVEGEKDVETLIANGYSHSTTNSGGAGKFPKSMCKYFQGAQIAIIPDNDDPGHKHAEQVAALLHGIATDIRVVNLPAPSKDVSDWFVSGGTIDALKKLIQTTPQWEPPTAVATPAPPPLEPAANTYDLKTSPFRLLGYNTSRYFFLSHETRQISAYTSKDLVRPNLTAIAPLSWWGRVFHGDNGPNWAAAVDTLQRESAKIGVFDARLLRGLGAWEDHGRIVCHCGDHLVVDGEITEISNFQTKYIYEATFPQGTENIMSLTKTQANKLITIMDLLPWKAPINGRLLSGWIVLAPICGALSWRPHIWVVGSSGTGKTWILENIVKSFLGKSALFVQSASTEAGIRQTLRNDARPVMFDEAEGEDERSQMRIQTILELARQASSETGGSICKGSANGMAVNFIIRSMFILSSIATNILQKADSTRWTILSLIKRHPNDAEDAFDELKEAVFSIITSEWCEKFRARSIKMLPIIIKNTTVFGRVMAKQFADQRTGDQLGTLLAGAYSLFSDDVISHNQAREWVSRQSWEEQLENDNETDDRRCLNTILQAILSTTESGTRKERSVGKLIYIASGRPYNYEKEELSELESTNILLRYGIKLEENTLLIADNHAGISKILDKTPWKNNWKEQLRRLPDTEKRGTTRFEQGSFSRACSIPLKIIFKE